MPDYLIKFVVKSPCWQSPARSIAFRRDHLTAAIHAGFKIDMVTQHIFASVGVFLIVDPLQLVMCAAVASAAWRHFSFRYSHLVLVYSMAHRVSVRAILCLWISLRPSAGTLI